MVQEKYPEAQRQLFGPGFEHGLRARSEAADTIAIKASKVSIPGRGKQGFCVGGEIPSEGRNHFPEADLPQVPHNFDQSWYGAEAVVEVSGDLPGLQPSPIQHTTVNRPNNLPKVCFSIIFRACQ